MDSGAGQCMTSCSEAFHNLQACAVMIIGVGGSMPAHGIGTARFIGVTGGIEYIITIHNCLLCHGEDGFNLLSVSQILRQQLNAVVFRSNVSYLETQASEETVTRFELLESDGLYEMKLSPLYMDDQRLNSATNFEITLEHDSRLWGTDGANQTQVDMKSPTKLGKWHSKMLWMSVKMAPMRGISSDFDEDLKSFCDSFFVPPSQPAARRTYKVQDVEDMADLSLRFMGLGTDRLVHTLKRSKGLTPASKKKGENVSIVPPHNFPQGRWKSSKAPKVSKDKVKFLHKASIAEVCFTDTFETDDNGYKYGQAFVDYRSRYGDVQPLKSRKKIGWAFTEFCCRHFKPLILVRDNIGENVYGNLNEECLRLNVKSAFSCPYQPKQNYAENYLGRVTAMASFAMVFAGAPMFMWRWAIACAVFVNNISATFYSKEKLWATPYELTHGEPFPDASIVVPFGCAALILLEKDDRTKFQSTCAMVIFIHYAQDHPLYTYAFFSPRTKRVLYRQNCIFLPEIFPMREARSRGGFVPEGEALMVYRPKPTMGNDNDEHGSEMESNGTEADFARWKDDDPLPSYVDDITGHELVSPSDDTLCELEEKPADWPTYFPSNPSFGPSSVVPVPKPWGAIKFHDEFVAVKESSNDGASKDEKRPERLRRNRPSGQPPGGTRQKRPVKERWFYEPIQTKESTMLISSLSPVSSTDNVSNLIVGSQEYVSDDWLANEIEESNDNVTVVHEAPEILLDDGLASSNLGPIEVLPEYLGQAADDEETARDIQGMILPVRLSIM